MYKTISTMKIWFHLKIKILYPILCIITASPWSYHCLGCRIITYITYSFCYWILYICNIY